MNEEKKFRSEAEEIAYLRKEVKRLTREANFAKSTLKRIRIASTAREGVNAVLRNERIRQDHTMNLILQYNPDILIVFDEKSRILYCADLFLRVTGIKHSGLVAGRHFADVFGRFIPPEKLEKLSGIFQNALRTGELQILEERFDFSGKGKERDYETLVTPLFNDAAETTGAIMILHDTTEIQNSIKRAEEASKAKSNFLANMSHEIRTPINAVIGMASIGSASPGIEKKDYCLDRIKSASTHLLHVINDILDMSKIEAGKFDLSITAFDFTAMLTGVVNVLSLGIEKKKLALSLAVDPAIPPVIVSDEQRLAQVISNLLSNAIKFTPGGGRVTVTAKLLSADGEAGGGCVIEVTVSDTGIGISPDQEAKLFHSFEQADNSISRKYGGTGLGLVISKRIVERMNGAIRVESELGKGSSFIVTIHAGSGGAQPEAGESILTSAAVPHCFDGCTILLAEDVAINREIVLSILEPTGARVEQAGNGKEAFEKFAAAPETYDLILMDIQMPEMGGYESTRLIRAMNTEKAATIPIIAMTANVFTEDIEHCMSAGMNGHLGKPLDFNEFFSALHAHLPRKIL